MPVRQRWQPHVYIFGEPVNFYTNLGVGVLGPTRFSLTSSGRTTGDLTGSGKTHATLSGRGTTTGDLTGSGKTHGALSGSGRTQI
jgi:hypothetical protein